MSRKSISSAFIIIAALLLASCKDKAADPYQELFESTSFYLRPCDSLTVWPSSVGFLFRNNTFREPLPFDELILVVTLSSTHHDALHIPFAQGRTNHDEKLERIIFNSVKDKDVSSLPQPSQLTYPEGRLYHNIEYRNEEIKGVSVTCTEELFGVSAGTSLNKHIEIYGAPLWHWFIIDNNNNYVGDMEQGMSIDTYLDFRPLAAAALYLRFKEVPEDLQNNLQFVVSVVMSDNRELRYKTKLIAIDKQNDN